MADVLLSLDRRPIPDAPGEIRLFCFLRNERARVPHLVRHYRELGVDRMFFIDNGSSDGTPEWLLEQEDCHVFHTVDSYAGANQGTDWANALLARNGVGYWCFLVDADEFFVYPDFETRSVHEFVRDLEEEGAAGVLAFMLDMYPSGSLDEAKLTDESCLLDLANCFDDEYAFQVMPSRPGKSPRFPGFRVIGGPRQRWARSIDRETKRGWMRLWLNAHLERLIAALPTDIKRRVVSRIWKSPQTLQKVPFIKAVEGFRWSAGAHTSTPVKLSNQTAVLLHFKFLSDFHKRAENAVKEGQYYLGGAQYMWYLDSIAKKGFAGLAADCSVRYKSSFTLAKAGLFQNLDMIRGSDIVHVGKSVNVKHIPNKI